MADLIFISHSSGDALVARALRAELQRAGHGVFMAPDDIHGAAPWPEQIEAALANCVVAVLILSERSNRSRHVAREVSIAVGLEKPVLPLRLEPLQPEGSLSYLLRLTQRVDLFPGPIESHFGKVVEEVRSLASADPPVSKGAPPPGTCPICGERNPAGARFCHNCASTLMASARPRETRKTVTILFCDVAGSTALGEQLDPESMRALMGRYFAPIKTIIERHGGTVEKFIGDAVMAVFGIPVLREDDALRAVRAAAEIRDAVGELNAELQSSRGFEIALRTGVNTGEVVAGDPSSGQTLVTGDAVNTAARLEQAAERGEILLGELTFRLVRDAVDADAVSPLQVKGKSRPVPAYRLLSVNATAEGHTRRLDAPMVGRERELARLQAAYRQAIDDRAPQLFTLLGAAGIGKSRLVAEFLGSVAGEATVLGGRCLSYGEGITYWPLGEVVRQAAGISEADSAAEAELKVTALLEDERDGALLAKRISSAIGLSTESAPQEEIFWAARKLLEGLARLSPLIVVIEDIHWAEPTLLDLIEHIAELARDVPLLLLCPARPELLDDRPNWGGGKLNATTLLLEPLAQSATAELVEVLPGGAALPPALRSRILEAAEGNPLYVEEMLGMLVDEGLLAAEADGWRATAELAALHVPPSVQALIAARLDRLPQSERALVEHASVVGRIFERSAVAELGSESLTLGLSRDLLALVRKELVRPDRSELTADDAFRFRHALIRDAAYEGLPKTARAQLHERFATWLERTAGARLREYEEIVGYHLEQAHRYRTELGETGPAVDTLGRAAGDHLHAVGKRAMRNGDIHAAVELLRRAVAAVAAGNEREKPLWELDLGVALGDIDPAAAHALLGTIIDNVRADTEGTTAIRARVEQLVLERNLAPVGYLKRLTAEVPGLIEGLTSVSDDAGVARLCEILAFAHLDAGQISEARADLERALPLTQRAGDEYQQEQLQVSLLQVFTSGNMPAGEGLRMAKELLPTVRSRRAALYVRQVMAQAHGLLGEPLEAKRQLVEIARDQRELGLLTEAAYTGESAAYQALRNDEPTDALALAQSAAARYEEIGDIDSIAQNATWVLGPALVALGRSEEALEVLDTKVSNVVDAGSLTATAAAITRAEALLRLGRRAEAVLAFDSISEFDVLQGTAARAIVLVRAAQVADELGRPEDGRRLAEAARAVATEKGHVLAIDLANGLLAKLDPAEQAVAPE